MPQLTAEQVIQRVKLALNRVQADMYTSLNQTGDYIKKCCLDESERKMNEHATDVGKLYVTHTVLGINRELDAIAREIES